MKVLYRYFTGKKGAKDYFSYLPKNNWPQTIIACNTPL